MGKKKSVVLMTLITIVILVLCAIVAFPKVTVPGSGGIKKWNPATMQFDLGAEFGGGHYAYYYPNGVISETEYDNNVSALEGKELTEYQQSYKKYKSLYLSTDEDDCIYTEGNAEEVSQGFKDAFEKAVKIVDARFAKRAQATGSSYRVSVVDDYAIRVDLSATENTKQMDSASYALNAFMQYANLGALTFEVATSDATTTVDQLKDDDATVNDLIKSVSVKNKYEVSYVKIVFTDKGKQMIKEFKANTDATALNLKMGEEVLLAVTTDSITDKNEVMFGLQYEEQSLIATTLCVVINSALEEGTVLINGNDKTPFDFKAPTSSEVRTYAPVYGDVFVWVLVAVLAVILAACVIAIVKMGGFGVMNLYTSLSYTVIVALCYAFISGGVFAVTLGSVFVFLAGLALTNVLHAYIYKAIKAEVALGKTVVSAVKGGYKKTLWTLVDVYAVLLLGGVALLLGVAATFTLACQILICVVAAAFCTLLWGRVLNVLLLSASKDKYKYFRLVREDEDDE